MVIFRHSRGGGFSFFGGAGTANSQLLRFTPFFAGSAIAYTGGETNARMPIAHGLTIIEMAMNSAINSKTAGNTVEVVRENGVNVPNTTITIPFGSTGEFTSGAISEHLDSGSLCNFSNDCTGQVSGGITVAVICTFRSD